METITLLTRLIDCHVKIALIICDPRGQIVWANDYARSVAADWGIFQFRGNELLITDRNLLTLLVTEPDRYMEQPKHSYFSAGPLFFDVSRLFGSDQPDEAQLIGLTIDCHALEDCGKHSLDELSPSECRLIACLKANHPLKEASRLLNISYENARTKLKHIFEKLNVHSQRELLIKVRHLPAGEYNSSATPNLGGESYQAQSYGVSEGDRP